MRHVDESIRTMKLSETLFLNVRFSRLEEMDAQSVDYEAAVSWFSNAQGDKLSDVTCSCTSGGCSQSGTCANGDINCDCVNCTFSCS